jgi:hypothetical protein
MLVNQSVLTITVNEHKIEGCYVFNKTEAEDLSKVELSIH